MERLCPASSIRSRSIQPQPARVRRPPAAPLYSLWAEFVHHAEGGSTVKRPLESTVIAAAPHRFRLTVPYTLPLNQ
jgi:hypothetical protein